MSDKATQLQEGRLAYNAALNEHQNFPKIPWKRGESELEFRLCAIVEDNLELLTSRPYSNQLTKRLRITKRVREELAQRLLGHHPMFEKLFLEYPEAAHWHYGKQVSAKFHCYRQKTMVINHLSEETTANLRQKVETLVSYQTHGRKDGQPGGSSASMIFYVEQNPLGSVEPEPEVAGPATETETAKRATVPDTATHTTKPETEKHTAEPDTTASVTEPERRVPGKEGRLPGITASSRPDSTTQDTFSNILGTSGQVTTTSIGQTGMDATNSSGIAHGIAEPMAANLMEHQDGESKPARDKARVLTDGTSSDIAVTHMMGPQEASAGSVDEVSRDGECESLSELSGISDDDGIEFEDVLQPSDFVDRNGELLPGTPLAIDEDDGASAINTTTLGPGTYDTVYHNAQTLELTWPAVNMDSNEIQSAETSMVRDYVVDEAYSDSEADVDSPRSLNLRADTDKKDHVYPEDSVSDEGQYAGSPMALDSEIEEYSENFEADVETPQSATLNQSKHNLMRDWAKDNEDSDKRLLPASRKHDREDGDNEDGIDEEFTERSKRVKLSTNWTPVAHSDNDYSTPGLSLQNTGSGQDVVGHAASQQDNDCLEIIF